MTLRDMRSRTRINICFSCNLFSPVSSISSLSVGLYAVFDFLHHTQQAVHHFWHSVYALILHLTILCLSISISLSLHSTVSCFILTFVYVRKAITLILLDRCHSLTHKNDKSALKRIRITEITLSIFK